MPNWDWYCFGLFYRETSPMGGANPKWTLSPSFPTSLSSRCVVGALTCAVSVSLIILKLGA